MIVDNSTPEAKKALRTVDINGSSTQSIISFNTITKIATIVVNSKIKEVVVERFCFVSGNDLKRVLPKNLHDHVVPY